MKQPRNPEFTSPPQWFHEAEAAKCFSRKESPLQTSRRREAKRRALLQMLYDVPPLYHLNQHEFGRHKRFLKTHYAFFSPLHREAGLLPLTEFSWLTADHLVQRTVFGRKIELVANFGATPFVIHGTKLPGKSILAYRRDTHQTRIYTPGDGAEEE